MFVLESVAVSVVCLTYNQEEYIRDALNGFVSQKTDFPFEVIVHDDASTDGTAAIIREFEERYPEIIKPVYEEENQYSKHRGIYYFIIRPLIRGKYVAFCEGDDYWTDDRKLQKQYDYLEAHPEYTMCACASTWVDMKTGKSFPSFFSRNDTDVSMEDVIVERKGRPFQYASFFIRTEIWNRWPRWRHSYPVGDTPVAILAAQYGKIRYIAQEMCVYRWRSASSWTAKMDDESHRVKEFEQMIGAIERFNDATDRQYDDIVRARVLSLRYKIALSQRDFRAIRSGELRQLYRERTVLQRLADFCRCKLPAVYQLVKKWV